MSKKLIPCLGLIAAFALGVSPLWAQAQGDRRALVIGTSYYDDLDSLDLALSDARKVEEILGEAAGFEVTRIVNATARGLRAQIQAFVETIRPNDVVLVYYAGHGVQSGGRNYILPSDFPADASRLADLALPVDELLRDIGARQPVMKLMILDACRNSPLPGGSDGLARMEPGAFGQGTHIEFAASAGQVATDGLFADQLVAELARPGQNVDDVFRNVRAKVVQASGGQQTPMSASQLTINFYFIPTRLAGPGEALELLERVATAGLRGEAGQTEALEALVQQEYGLGGTDLLEGLTLQDGTFNGGALSDAALTGTDFSRASLRGADLSGASLNFGMLRGTDLSAGRLAQAQLAFVAADSAILGRVVAPQSAWFGARARGADFAGADLRRAIFAFTDLRGANFDGANLTGALIFHSDLRAASFDGAELDSADFAGSRLDPTDWQAVERAGACSSPLPREPEGPRYAYVMNVVAIEPIPNPRYDGDVEYSRFSETGHLFLMERNTLPACGDRVLDGNPWSPLWQVGMNESVVEEVRFRISHDFLEQTGRRQEVPRRIRDQMGWLYPLPTGEFTTVVPLAGIPPDSENLAGNWLLEITGDGRVILNHQGMIPVNLRYEPRPPESIEVSGGEVLGCSGRPQEYVYQHTEGAGLRWRASYNRDACAARRAILTAAEWRERR